MSRKSNSFNSNSGNGECNHWGRAPSTDHNVKLAGDEAKDRMYEPKHKKKLVRVLTVIAYIFFVSLAAIMLSLYYVFIWKGSNKDYHKPKTLVVTMPPKCPHEDEMSEALVELPQKMSTLTKRAAILEEILTPRKNKIRSS